VKARWVRCTPEFLSQHPSACGSTVRRPRLVPVNRGLGGLFEAPRFEAVGHEHLVLIYGRSGEMERPIEHESGEPA